MSKIYNKVIKTIEGLGFHVEQEENGFLISKFSPAGQDFSFEIEGETLEELINNTYDYYENYDVSYETYLWLDDTGHGTNGAPCDMKDLYEDMEACKEMIYEIYEALKAIEDIKDDDLD